MTKGIIYYTNNKCAKVIMDAVIKRLKKIYANMEIISASQALPRIVTSHRMFNIFNLKIPIINFRSGNGMHGSHACVRGTPEEVINKFL